MIFRVALGDHNGVLVAVRHIVAGQGKAGGVEMVEALIEAFLPTDGQGQFAKQQVTAIGVDVIEGPAEFKAVEHLSRNPRTKQQIEGLVGKELGRQG